jgi:GNAT superfamily N-acetyltransferase
VTQTRARPYLPADADDLTALFNAIDVAAGRPAVLTASLVADFIGGMVRDTETDTRLVLDESGLVAVGLVSTPPPGGHVVDLAGGVAPGARGQGIGRSVLGWQLSRAEQIHAANGAGAPWEAHADVSQLDTSAVALLARFGLSPVRYSFDMHASTADVADQPVPAGVTITAYDPDLSTAVHDVHMDTFADNWGFQYRPFDMWSSATVNSTSFNRDLSVLAMTASGLAGYVLAYDDAIADQVYLGQVGVARSWRRQGVATAMLAHVLRTAAGAGRTTAALDVDAASATGAVGVYERVGFHTEHTVMTCSRPLA